jgi:hypothetical protein
MARKRVILTEGKSLDKDKKKGRGAQKGGLDRARAEI